MYIIFRIAILLAVVAIAGGLLAYVLTKDRRYLALSWRTLKVTVVFALLVFGLMAIERLGLAIIPF